MSVSSKPENNQPIHQKLSLAAAPSLAPQIPTSPIPIKLLQSEKHQINADSITILTYFNFQDKVSHTTYYDLINKSRLLFNKNNWLMSTVSKKAFTRKESINLVYDKDKAILNDHFSYGFESEIFDESPDAKNFEKRMETVQKYDVGRLSNIIEGQKKIQKQRADATASAQAGSVQANNADPNKPLDASDCIPPKLAPKTHTLSRISFIRNHQFIPQSTKLCLIFSVNSILADVNTIFTLLHMLDDTSQISRLSPERYHYNCWNNQELFEETNLCDDKKEEITWKVEKASKVGCAVKSWTRRNKGYKNRVFYYKVDRDSVNKVKDNFRKEISAKQEDPSKKDENELNNTNSDQENLLTPDPNFQLPLEFISTNDILTSEYFKLNSKANNILMSVDLRFRLESLKTKYNLAGNYSSSLLLSDEDVKSALGVRKKVNGIKKIELFSAEDMDDDENADNADQEKEKAQTQAPVYQQIPTFSALKKYHTGTIKNYSPYFRPLNIAGFNFTHQMPHVNLKKLNEKILGRFQKSIEDHLIVFRFDSERFGCLMVSGSGKILRRSVEGVESKVFGEFFGGYRSEVEEEPEIEVITPVKIEKDPEQEENEKDPKPEESKLPEGKQDKPEIQKSETDAEPEISTNQTEDSVALIPESEKKNESMVSSGYEVLKVDKSE